MPKRLTRGLAKVAIVVAVSGWLPVSAILQSAQAIPVPPGLKKGDRYYLAFITDGQIAANDPNIKTFNDFVNAEAARKDSIATGAKWFAIASTATVDAKDNLNFAGQSEIAPIYLLDGKTEVVKQARDLFSGNALLNGISIDQFGKATASLNVWTGTGTDGKKTGTPIGADLSTRGRPGRTDSTWINQGAGPSRFADDFYAVSEMLTVVPEPSTWLLLAAGVGAVAWRVRRRDS